MDNKKFIAGGLSGIVEVSLTHPLDYMKIKSQEYKQLNKTKKNFFKEISPNGFRSFYSGYIPRVMGIIPMRLAFWGSQDATREFLLNNNINTHFNFLLIALSGGFAQSLVDNQAEIIKISQMTNMPRKQLWKTLIKFRGFNANLIRNIGFTTCISYFCFNDNFQHVSTVDKFKYAGIGAVIGGVLTQPFDYVKTQKQRENDPRGMMEIIKTTARKNPLQLYSGGLYRASLGFCNMGIGFVAFDFIKKFL